MSNLPSHSDKPVGLTKDVGYQIGVRRTLPIDRDALWTLLISAECLPMWLGRLASLPLTAGQTYVTEEGTSGQMRVVKPQEQLRLTWKPQSWQQHSTVQVRLLGSGPCKTTVSFHQEKLADAETRERMRLHWEGALERITKYFAK